jgi:hypothetical protein
MAAQRVDDLSEIGQIGRLIAIHEWPPRGARTPEERGGIKSLVTGNTRAPWNQPGELR